jgi:hypothetical protein
MEHLFNRDIEDQFPSIQVLSFEEFGDGYLNYFEKLLRLKPY